MSNMGMIFRAVWKTVYERPADWLQSLPTDKLLHFMISFIIMLCMCFLFDGWLLGLSVTLGIGVFKEVVIDKWLRKTQIDFGDLLADFLGAVSYFFLMQVLLNMYQFIYK